MNKLQQSISLMFKAFDKPIDQQMIQLYFKTLSRYDEQTICNRIMFLIETSKWLPRIAEILEPFHTSIETEMEKDWAIFINTMNNNFRFAPIPNWVLTIKKHIGEQRCEDVLETEMVWLKKDFEKVYPLVKKGYIKMIADQAEYVQIGSATVPLDEIGKSKMLCKEYNEGNYEVLKSPYDWEKDLVAGRNQKYIMNGEVKK